MLESGVDESRNNRQKKNPGGGKPLYEVATDSLPRGFDRNPMDGKGAKVLAWKIERFRI